MRSVLLALALLAACSGGPQTLEVVPSTAVPPQGATGVALDVLPSIGLSAAEEPASAADALHLVRDGQPVAGTSDAGPGATLVFAPAVPLAPGTLYTVRVDGPLRDLHGHALGHPYRWSFTTRADPEPPPPAVVAVAPADGEREVPLLISPSIEFSERMAPSVVDAVALLGPAGEKVPTVATLSADGRTVAETPDDPLAPDSTYALDVTVGAMSLAKTPLAVEARFHFHTAQAVDGHPVLVESTSPADGATEVSVRVQPTATVSAPLDPTTVGGGFSLAKADGTPVAAAATLDAAATTLQLAPGQPLETRTTYVATLEGLKSAQGDVMNPLQVSVRFTTSADPLGGLAPEVSSVDPADGATDVATATPIEVQFTRPMDLASFSSARPTVTANGLVAPAGISLDPSTGRTLAVTPIGAWPADADIVLSLPAGLVDAADHLPLAPWSTGFHTKADHTPPAVEATDPADGATGVPAATSVTFYLSEAIQSGTAQLQLSSGPANAPVPVPGVTSYDDTTWAVTFLPDEVLPLGVDYAATLSGATDLAGNLAAPATIHFTTGGTPDTTPPTFAGLVSAQATDETDVALTWNPATDAGSRHLVYLVFAQPGGSVDFTQPPTLTTGRDVTGATVGGLLPGQPYALAVRAEDASGNVDQNQVIRTVTTPDWTPPVFGGLTAMAQVPGQVALQLSWNAATDNAASADRILYRVYLAQSAGGETFKPNGFAAQTDPGATTIAVTDEAPGVPLLEAHTYFAVVHAVDPSGNESTGNVELSAPVADVTPPVFDGTVNAAPYQSTSIQVSWQSATDNIDQQSQLTYQVSISTAQGGPFTALDDFSSGLSFIATQTCPTCPPLDNATTYWFQVEARDSAGNVTINPNKPSTPL